jgi:recombination protein RecT
MNKDLTIQGLLTNYKDQIALALPKHMNADRMARIALTIIRKNKNLADCNPISLFGAIIQASQLGLEVGIHAHLVPFYNKQTKQKEVQMIPDYRGLMHLARNSGEISLITAQVVYSNDPFDYKFGTNAFLNHKPSNNERGNLIGAYAIAQYKDGPVQFEYMTKNDIDLIKNRSKAKDDGPWITDYPAMAKKTVIRMLCKLLPVSVELQRAIILDETNEIGDSQNNIAIIDADFEIDISGKPEVDMPVATNS